MSSSSGKCKEIFLLGLSPSKTVSVVLEIFLRLFGFRIITYESVFNKKRYEISDRKVCELEYSSRDIAGKSVEIAQNTYLNLVSDRFLLSGLQQDIGLRFYEIEKDMQLFLLEVDKRAVITDPYVYSKIDSNTKIENISVMPRWIVTAFSCIEVFVMSITSLLSLRAVQKIRYASDILAQHEDNGRLSRFHKEISESQLSYFVTDKQARSRYSGALIYGLKYYCKFVAVLLNFLKSSPIVSYNVHTVRRIQYVVSAISQYDFSIYHGVTYLNGIESFVLHLFSKRYVFIDVSSSVIHNNPVVRLTCPSVRIAWSEYDHNFQSHDSDYRYVGGNIYHLNKSECVKDKIIVYDNLISDSYYYSVKFSIIFFTAITDLAEAYKDFEFVLKIKSKEVLKQKKISAIYEQLSSQDNVSISVESHGINYLNSSIATISLGLNSAGILAASAGVKSIFFVPNDFYIDSTVGRLTCATQYSDLSSFLDHSLSSHVLDRLTVIDRELCSAPASYIEFVKHMQSEEL